MFFTAAKIRFLHQKNFISTNYAFSNEKKPMERFWYTKVQINQRQIINCKIMAIEKRNKPSKLVIVVISVLVLMIIIYFILGMFLPDLFQLQNTPAGR